MAINSPKSKIILFYKELFTTYINNTHTDSLVLEKNKIVKDFINQIKLSNQDYLIMEKEILTELENLSLSQTNELHLIIKCIKTRFRNCKLEYISKDHDPAIYFNISNNKSYLINYDSIDKQWYLSIIEPQTLNLIEEVYSDYYDEFIKFLYKISI